MANEEENPTTRQVVGVPVAMMTLIELAGIHIRLQMMSALIFSKEHCDQIDHHVAEHQEKLVKELQSQGLGVTQEIKLNG